MVGHKPGKGNCTGMLGALECELPNGKRFDVGSGFNMDQRRKPPKIGSVITFKFQELSNAGHPRFPVFLRMRTDLTWNDVLEAAKTKKPVSIIQKVIPSAKLSKQHSILFSVIPSRDAKTGGKIVTSDDEDEDATSSSTTTTATTSSSSKKTDTRKMCQYGAKCYRTNADHLKNFQHPSAPSSSASSTASTASSAEATASTKPPCTFGSKCYRNSAIHLATYSHAARSQTKDAVELASEEDVLDTKELIEADEPPSPTAIDGFLVKDKNKGLAFDDNEDDDAEATDEMITRPKKEWANLEKKYQEQSKRLAHLEEIFKATKRSNSSSNDETESAKRLKTN